MITQEEIKEVMDNLYKVNPEIQQLFTITKAGDFIVSLYNPDNHKVKGDYIKKKEDIFKLWKKVGGIK